MKNINGFIPKNYEPQPDEYICHENWNAVYYAENGAEYYLETVSVPDAGDPTACNHLRILSRSFNDWSVINDNIRTIKEAVYIISKLLLAGKTRYLRFTYPDNNTADDLMCVQGCSLTENELKLHVSEALRQEAEKEYADDYEIVDATALLLSEKLECKVTVVCDESDFEVKAREMEK